MAVGKTILSAATSSRRSGVVAWGFNGSDDVLVTVRGTVGSGSATIDVSHDGTNWVSTGTTLDTDTRTQLVTLTRGTYMSLNYTAAGSPLSSWTVEVS